MARVIVITSGKGGTGKTTTAINLSASLNSFGKNVIVVDANLTTPNIGIHLGAPIVPISLHHVMQGKNSLREAIYEHHSGTKILPASLSLKELRGVRPEKLRDVARQLKRYTDIIIFDSAAGLGREAINAIQAADELLVVVNPELPSVTDALKTIKLAEELGKSIRGVILTRTRGDGKEIKKEDIKIMLEYPILGTIPEDEAVRESLVLRDAVVHTHPRSNAAIAYKKLAAKLLGKRYVEREEKAEKERLGYKILKALGLRK